MFLLNGRWVSIMVCFVVGLHLIWAATLAATDDAFGVTSLSSMLRWIPMPWLPAALTIASALALAILTVRDKPWYVLLLLPQQLLLLMSAFGVLEAVWIAQYADGVIRPRGFIFADQVWVLLACAGHTAAIVAHVMRVARR